MYKEKKTILPVAQKATTTSITKEVRVDVDCFYVPEMSEPYKQTWCFGADISITNEGASPIRILGHNWVITDAAGEVEQLKSLGIVDEQPLISPGESFTYVAECELSTPFGSLEGHYIAIHNNGPRFNVKIPPSFLAQPFSIN